MRAMWLAAALTACTVPALQSEIRDVLKGGEIEARLAKVQRPIVVHQRSNFAISLTAQAGGPGAFETHRDADEVLFVRRGAGVVWLGNRRYQTGAGDIINVRRGMGHRIDAPSGRVEYIAVRIFPTGEGLLPHDGLLAPRNMPDVLRASEIAKTFQKFESNQPIHSALNFTMNYVIYSGHSGPWEAHRGCVDIYFVNTGTAIAQLGGQIRAAKEETSGEIRGTSVTGARQYEIGPGDIVVIPRNTAHHIDPGTGKFGYVLVKVWAE